MITRMKSLVGAVAMAMALTGCISNGPIGADPGIEVTNLTELPAPSITPGMLVAPRETLKITVAGADLLRGDYLVDDNGYISFPLVGDLYVAGKEPNAIGNMIADRLRGEYVVDPQVNVVPAKVLQLTVSIGGEVKRPGTFPSNSSNTLLRAINNAGGMTDIAARDEALIMRDVDGQSYIGVYNIAAIRRGNYPDPAVYPEDIITVGESRSLRLVAEVVKYISLASSSIILLNRVQN